MKIAITHNQPETISFLQDLLTDLGHTIYWTATGSRQTISNCKHKSPDLLLIDTEIDETSTKDVIHTIMATQPTTIIVTSDSNNYLPSKIFEAMSAGALDALKIPIKDDIDSINELQRKIKNIVNLHKDSQKLAPPKFEIHNIPLIAIGASTGGPAAIVKILSMLPVNLGASIVIVQHMDNQFTKGLVKWIDEQTKIKVAIPKANQLPEANVAYIAAGNDHLILKKNGCFDYTPDPIDYSFRPSVDVFFESAVAHWPNTLIGVLLTGMGKDGASGLLSFHNRNMLTIAQDKASCAVFGMPKAAIELGAVAMTLPLNRIANAIMKELAKEI
jgi:two-component system response regulator WspF